MMKRMLNSVHNQAVFKRRVRVLSNLVGNLIKVGEHTGLDIGCGDGSIATNIIRNNKSLLFDGVDVIERPAALIPTTLYDGVTLPFESNSYDFVVIVDVLHHCDHPDEVLAEASRVCRKAIIIKDHLCENKFNHATLRFMDWVGNRGHEVRLPYNYLSRARWTASFEKLHLDVDVWQTTLNLYPQPFDLVFGGKLHFLARIEK